MKNPPKIRISLLQYFFPVYYFKYACSKIMRLEKKIKISVVTSLEKTVEATINDPWMRQKVGKDPNVTYKEMLSNEKMSQTFSSLGRLISQNDRKGIPKFLQELKDPSLRTINFFLNCALFNAKNLKRILDRRELMEYLLSIENISPTERKRYEEEEKKLVDAFEKFTHILEGGSLKDL